MRGKKGTTSVKHDVKQYVRRVSHVLKGADEGSGTISGVALIAIVAAMLGAVAMAGNLLLCVHRAQNTADLASVAAAQSLRDGAADPCAAASRTTSGNGTRLESCAIEGEDAVGAVRADTLVGDGAAQPADVIFVLRAGFAADTLLPGIATDKGHIVVDESYAARIPGVFAAGDCTGAPYQIPAAVGEGNRAALSVVRWLRNA